MGGSSTWNLKVLGNAVGDIGRLLQRVVNLEERFMAHIDWAQSMVMYRLTAPPGPDVSVLQQRIVDLEMRLLAHEQGHVFMTPPRPPVALPGAVPRTPRYAYGSSTPVRSRRAGPFSPPSHTPSA